MYTKPTDLPTRDQHPVLVTRITIPRPATETGALRAAARLIARNGHYQNDLLPDPFDRVLTSPHALRPMSIVAALRCAVSGDPHVESLLADSALTALAVRLVVDGEGPRRGDMHSLEAHVDAWGDAEGRTAECVVAVLEAAADASEVAA